MNAGGWVNAVYDGSKLGNTEPRGQGPMAGFIDDRDKSSSDKGTIRNRDVSSDLSITYYIKTGYIDSTAKRYFRSIGKIRTGKSDPC